MSDLISRQAAIDAANRADCTGVALSDVKAVTDEVVKELKKLPSAGRRGRWINGNEGIWNAVILPKCSICGETFYEMNVNINGEYTYNYCPNCGARMEETP